MPALFKIVIGFVGVSVATVAAAIVTLIVVASSGGSYWWVLIVSGIVAAILYGWQVIAGQTQNRRGNAGTVGDK